MRQEVQIKTSYVIFLKHFLYVEAKNPLRWGRKSVMQLSTTIRQLSVCDIKPHIVSSKFLINCICTYSIIFIMLHAMNGCFDKVFFSPNKILRNQIQHARKCRKKVLGGVVCLFGGLILSEYQISIPSLSLTVSTNLDFKTTCCTTGENLIIFPRY